MDEKTITDMLSVEVRDVQSSLCKIDEKVWNMNEDSRSREVPNL